jgi:HK97 family phage portal protein
LAHVPCKVFQKKNDRRLPAENLSLYELLNDSPNEWMTSYDFFEAMGLHLTFCGNFFAFKNITRGRIVELLPYEPQTVTVTRKSWETFYEVTTADGKKNPVPAANMWHVRGPSWNTWYGLEGVRLAREAIGLALATEQHGAQTFKNGTSLSGILTTDQVLSKEKAKELREAWVEQYAGLQKAGGTAVTWGGLKYQVIAMMNDQAQFNETRRMQIEEVCRSLRIMPIMVGHTSDKASTYASAEQMFLAHAIYSMGPWYRRIEKSIDKFLLTPEERKTGCYTKFIINALMRSAARDRGEYYGKALGSGGSPAWMTPDEIRELEELDPMGGEAAKLPTPTNVGGAAPPAGGAEDAQN